MNRPNDLLPPAFYHRILKNKTFYFTEIGDTEELYNKNKQELDSSWTWYDKEITYSFNDHGFRMNKQITDIRLDNYVLFIGCSYTVGVGMSLEHTFAYRIADTLGCDYINAGVSFASASHMISQLQHLLLNTEQYPKAIYINWSNVHSIQCWKDNKYFLYAPENSRERTPENDFAYDVIIEHFNDSESAIKKTNKCHDMATILCEQYNIPLYSFSSTPHNVKYKHVLKPECIGMDESTLPINQRSREFNSKIHVEHHSSYMHDLITNKCLEFYANTYK
jgi:hypothetical protein